MSLLDECFANEFRTLVDKRKSPARGRKQRASGKSAGALDVVPAGGRVRPSNALAFMLEQPFRVDATMTHSLPLGTTGSGDVWLVSLAAKRGRHDVFLYGHDTGSVEHVADSVEAIALALHLSDRDAAPTAAERRMLAGHVVNNDDIDLAWLGKKRFAKTSSPVQRLHERTYDLRSTLNGYGRHLPAPAGKLPARPVPAKALDAMLRAFLRVEDQALDALFVRFAEAPSGLVRDPVSLLRKLLGQRAPATFEGRARLLQAPPKTQPLDAGHGTGPHRSCRRA